MSEQKTESEFVIVAFRFVGSSIIRYEEIEIRGKSQTNARKKLKAKYKGKKLEIIRSFMD